MNDKTQQPVKNLKPSYRLSYLLRLWRTDELGNSSWQASLENPETGKRIGFANLEQLFAYLMDLIEGNFNKQPDTGKERMDETGKRI
jgi:hypothetical protein